MSADTKTITGQIVYVQKEMWPTYTGSISSEHVSNHINKKLIFVHLIFTSRTTCKKHISFVKRGITKIFGRLVWILFISVCVDTEQSKQVY
jgi:hypothetical protein